MPAPSLRRATHSCPCASILTRPTCSGLATYGGPPPSAREAYGSQPGSARDGPTQEPFTPAPPMQATAVVEGSMRSPDEAKAEVRQVYKSRLYNGACLSSMPCWTLQQLAMQGADELISPAGLPLQLRELDVRSASAALPRIKPHWSHRWAAHAALAAAQASRTRGAAAALAKAARLSTCDRQFGSGC